MPSPSSKSVRECYRGRSVRVFRLEREAILLRLQQRAEEVVEDLDVLEVWLFGSLARGEALPGSDADLLVVLRDGETPPFEHIPLLLRRFGGLGIGCDILPFSETEWARARTEGRRIARTIEKEGVLLRRASPGQ